MFEMMILRKLVLLLLAGKNGIKIGVSAYLNNVISEINILIIFYFLVDLSIVMQKVAVQRYCFYA